MSSALLYLVSFLVALGVLVTVHEFGHFWVARRLGVKVLRFSVGFGKPLWSRRSRDGETEYVIGALPLGGYVKMLDEREGEVAPSERSRAFNNKSPLTRIAVVAAGPVFNLLFAVAVFWVIFLVGMPGLRPVIGAVQAGSYAARSGFVAGDELVRIGGRATPIWEAARLALLNGALEGARLPVEVRDPQGKLRHRILDLRGMDTDVGAKDMIKKIGFSPWRPEAVLGKVLPGKPAARAGLQRGDRIVAVNGKPVQYWGDWVEDVRAHPGKQIQLTIVRDGRRFKVDVTPEVRGHGSHQYGQVGVEIPERVRKKLTAVERYGPLNALGAGLEKTWEMSALMARVLGGMFTGHASLANVSGPLTIAQYAGESASLGLLPFLGFLGVVSVSLGLLNLLPIPILDGGHLMYYLIELVKGSPVSEQAQSVGQRIGILLLLMVMALAFYNDFLRLFH